MPDTALAGTSAPDETAAAGRLLIGGRIPLARLRDLALVPAILIIAVVGQIVSPVFLQPDNLLNVLQTMSETALLVLAETMILIVKKMDLSLESTMGLAPGVAAWLVVPVGPGASSRDRVGLAHQLAQRLGETVLLGGESEVHQAPFGSPRDSRGSPRMRSAITLRCTSLVPA